jgi:CRP/FNR family cyclic AMP-dependent transcriptional regulator
MSDDESKLQQLRKSMLGEVLDDRHLAELVQIAESIHLPAGTTIFKEGMPANALWLVSSGSIALDMQVPGRGAVRLLTLGPRDMLGWSALVGDGSMTTNATVTADAHLLKMPAQRLKELCLADHTLGYAIMGNVARMLANRLRGTRLQLLDLFAETEPPQSATGGVSV